MRNSHNVTIFLASLMVVAKANAMSRASKLEESKLLSSSEALLSEEQMNTLFGDGFLQYDPMTNTVAIRSEAAKKLTADRKAELMIRSIRRIFGPDVTINVVPTTEMQLASQDRQSGG